MPVGRARSGRCVRPFHLGGRPAPDLGHDRRIHRLQYAGGRMDGFVRAASRTARAVERSVMGYYDGRDLPFYWNVAEEYVLFDRFFAATPGGSVANHMLWVAGRRARGRPEASDGGLRHCHDLRPARAPAGSRGSSMSRTTTRACGHGRRVRGVRVPAHARYVDDPQLLGHIVDLDEYYEDLARTACPRSRTSPRPARASIHRTDRRRARRSSGG